MAFGMTTALYLKSSVFRAYMQKRRRMPKDIFAYFAYAVFVGRRA
jgi:hypothetical protein